MIKVLLLLYLVRYRRGRTLLHMDSRRHICGILLHIAKDGGPPWSAEEGKEFYKAINEVGHKDSELLFTSLHGLESSNPTLSWEGPRVLGHFDRAFGVYRGHFKSINPRS